MARCAGLTAKGDQCMASAAPGAKWCFNHDPARAEERTRNASRAARSKPNKATKDLHELLEDLTERVISGELETSRGAVVAQLINTRIRLLGHELKVKEVVELEERLALLEEGGGMA